MIGGHGWNGPNQETRAADGKPVDYLPFTTDAFLFQLVHVRHPTVRTAILALVGGDSGLL